MTDQPNFTDVSSLGVFSLSLPVNDLAASLAFYSKLGFTHTGGQEGSWAIITNGSTTIGLFHNMFDKPMLTFNPGWGPGASALEDFADVRTLRQQLVDKGIETMADTTQDQDTGPASFMVIDPDGNPILIDQHR